MAPSAGAKSLPPSVPSSSTFGRLEGQAQEAENHLNQTAKSIWEYESELFYGGEAPDF